VLLYKGNGALDGNRASRNRNLDRCWRRSSEWRVASVGVFKGIKRLGKFEITTIELPLPRDIAELRNLRDAEEHVRKRIEEAVRAMVQQNGVARTNSWADHLLTFGQYVIGGVLASSFVQQSLTQSIVGFLGVLVLIASLIKQQFRPDSTAREAKQMVGKFRTLIRSAEDQLAELRTKREIDASMYYALARDISKGLNEIERGEINTTRGQPPAETSDDARL
jgi:hypothetical protein